MNADITLPDASQVSSSRDPQVEVNPVPSLTTQTIKEKLPTPKVALPDKFTGKRSTLRTFLNQLELVFTLLPTTYASDAIKVATLGTLLSGQAAEWFNYYLEHATEYREIMNNWAAFKSMMQDNFGEQDRVTIAANRIVKLRQDNSSASQYAFNFRHFASQLNWNDEALIHHFKMGLNDEILNLMVGFKEPTTLTDTINLAIQLGNRLEEHHQQLNAVRRSSHRQPDVSRSSNNSRSFEPRYHQPAPRNAPSHSRPQGFSSSPQFSHARPHGFASSSQSFSGGSQTAPMDLDVMNRPVVTTPVAGRSPSEQERQHRRDNNLCFYCGGGNHTKVNCPLLVDRKGKGRRQ